MWNPFKRAQRDAELHLAALQALENVAKSQSDAYKTMAEALKDYFEAFKTSREPSRWVQTDLTEWKREQADLMAQAGLPFDATEQEKLRWVEHEMDS